MSTPFLADVKLGKLVPVDEVGRQRLKKLEGKRVKVDAKVPRSGPHHRLFWALATTVWQTLPESQQLRYPDVESLVAALKIIAGHRQLIVFPDGTQGYVPKSIAYDRMGQEEFSAFFEKCVDFICRSVLPNVSRDDLKREIQEMVGIRK